MPTDEETVFEIGGIRTRYSYEGCTYTATLADPVRIACVKDQDEVVASIDKIEWEQKVLRDDYNRLREEVAVDIRKGNKKEALRRIDNYADTQQSINSIVGSSKVAGNLAKDVEALRHTVRETFEGPAAEVEQKQKRNAKVLQYEGYVGRRVAK